MRNVLYILAQFNDEDISWIVRVGRRLTLAKGQIIIHQGVEAPDLFIVLDGEVEAEVANVGAVAWLAAGEIIGEMSFVDKVPPSATVRAVEPSTILAINKRAMERRLTEDIGFAARFYKALAIYLADRLRSTTLLRGKPATRLSANEIQADELDETVLDQVSIAGLRFEQILKTLMDPWSSSSRAAGSRPMFDGGFSVVRT